MAATEMKPLTDKQRRVYDLLSEGKTQSEIANDMGIKSLAGVNSHIAALKKKGYVDDDGNTVSQNGGGDDAEQEPDISGNADDDGSEDEVEASSNGSHSSFDSADVADSLRSAIESIDKALAAHQERQQEIEAEAEARAKQVASLNDAREQASTALSAIS